jgi:hypothetical protein
MNSLIEYIVSNKDNKELLLQVWCELSIFGYPDVLPQEYKPEWWDEEEYYYTPEDTKNWERLNYGKKERQEGLKWGFGDLIMDYIKTVVPDEEIRTAYSRFLKQKLDIDIPASELSI